LLHGFAFGGGEGLDSGVLIKRGVGGPEAGVGGAVDAFGFAVVEEFGGGAIRMQLDLVDGGDGLAGRVVKEDLKVPNAEVRDANVLDPAGGRELLELGPGLDEVPVREVFLQICGIGAGRPVLDVHISYD